MFRTIGILVAAFFLFTSIGVGQDNRFDVSLGGGAVIPNQPSGNGTTLTPTKSGRGADHCALQVLRKKLGGVQLWAHL